jgi:hypothetical protein
VRKRVTCCSRMCPLSVLRSRKRLATLLDTHQGFDPKARIDDEGVAPVLRLRTEYAQPQKFLAKPDKYIDLSYSTAALGL